MSVSEEYKLAKSLMWSTKDFSLADFIEEYPLPQVVLVEVGYCGVDERTTFSSGQILTLHTLRTISKIVCQVPHSNAVLVPITCELKAEVIPMDCYETIVTAYKLSTQYQNIKYIRVMEVGSSWNNNNLDSLKINDVLQIKKIETKNSVIRCKNLTTSEMVAILIDSTAVFVPLVVPETHTLAEIKKNFGFPCKIRFLDKQAEMKMMRSLPGRRKPSAILTDLGQMTAVEEIQEKEVIVTTVCSNLNEKLCLNVPTNLDIRVTVAEGFLSGDANYQKIVKTLDKQYNKTDLTTFKGLDVYDHLDAVEKTMKQLSSVCSVEEATPEITLHAREQLSENASRKQKPRLPFSLPEKKAPPLPPKPQESLTEKVPPARPPKPGPKSPKPGPKSPNQDANTRKPKARTFPALKSPDWLKSSLGSLQRTMRGRSSGDDEQAGNEYEKPIDQSEGLYATVEDIYESFDSDSSEFDGAEYTELDNAYQPTSPTSPRGYEKLLNPPSKAGSPPPVFQKPTSNPLWVTPSSHPEEKPLPPPPKITPPPLPSSQPPQSQNERQAIYEAIAKFPQDLSSLSVLDVSRLLRYLGMNAYVETFESELVDGEMLASMDEEAFESLNVKNFHIKKLVKFIGGWRPKV